MTDTAEHFTKSSKAVSLISIGSRRMPLAHLPLHISERKILLGLSDVSMLNVALALVLRLRMGAPFSWRIVLVRPQWFILLTLLWLLFGPAFDAYSLRTSRLPGSILCIVKPALLTLFTYLLIPYVTPYLLPSRLTTGMFVVLSLGLLSLSRALYALILAQPPFQRRALIVGAGRAGRTIVQAIRKNACTEYQLIGYIDDDPAKQGESIEGLPVLGTSRDLIPLTRASNVSEVILAITHLHKISPNLLQAILDCQRSGFRITFMPDLYEQITGKLPVEHIGYNLQALLPSEGSSTARLYAGLKRSMDIAISLVGLVILGLLLPFIALAIRFDSPGPIFYAQWRVGKGGKTFRLFKLRTMILGAEREGEAVWTEREDSRVTRVGRILRATHIDELPQFINVLKGEMSIVGPRPERPEFVAKLEKLIPFYQLRHSVRPGMAGWGLVNQGYGSSFEDALIKLEYDLYYIKHQSIYFDLLILLRTLEEMLLFRGR